VEQDGQLITLEEWHRTGLRELCFRELFGRWSTRAMRLIVSGAARQLGTPAADGRVSNPLPRRSSCLTFGRPASPVALVCLNQAGVMTSYQIPIDGSYYVKAELQSYSTTVPGTLLALPARPRLP
jgi:hypothetical protein